jgi:hypothetical protein
MELGFFQNLRTQFRSFTKLWKKILDVDNDVLYQHTKSQPKMTYIMCLAKNDKIWQNLED